LNSNVFWSYSGSEESDDEDEDEKEWNCPTRTPSPIWSYWWNEL